MFNTDDIYNEAVKNSSIHYEDNIKKENSALFFKFTIFSLILVVAYFGFDHYSKLAVDKRLIVENEHLVESKNSSELDYIKALESIENELEVNEVEASQHKDLTLALDNIMNESDVSSTSSYISKLHKEIGVKSESKQKSESNGHRTIVVKKGDTLRSIANKYYGNTQEYTRIIASNRALSKSNSMIYEGQKIILPY
jgi:LysM repeat protein